MIDIFNQIQQAKVAKNMTYQFVLLVKKIEYEY